MSILPSKPTLKRLPVYYKVICQLVNDGNEFVSSSQIAKIIGVDESQVRKDFSSIKFRGKSSAGFRKLDLKEYLENIMGLSIDKDAFLIGVGNLGSAVANCENNEKYGLNILALFDHDQTKVGSHVSGKEVFHLTKLPNLAYRLGVKTVVLTVPSYHAQEVTDFLVASGIKAIWNFTQSKLIVPESVIVKDEDIMDGFIDFSIFVSQRLKLWEISGDISLATAV